jgi:hypothetical protein
MARLRAEPPEFAFLVVVVVWMSLEGERGRLASESHWQLDNDSMVVKGLVQRIPSVVVFEDMHHNRLRLMKFGLAAWQRVRLQPHFVSYLTVHLDPRVVPLLELQQGSESALVVCSHSHSVSAAFQLISCVDIYLQRTIDVILTGDAFRVRHALNRQWYSTSSDHSKCVDERDDEAILIILAFRLPSV